MDGTRTSTWRKYHQKQQDKKAIIKKATAQLALRVAFRVKPISLIEVNCTAKNEENQPFCCACAAKFLVFA
jgi:hypothetical protein